MFLLCNYSECNYFEFVFNPPHYHFVTDLSPEAIALELSGERKGTNSFVLFLESFTLDIIISGV